MRKIVSLFLPCVLLLSVFTGLTLHAAAEDAALTVYVQYGAEGEAKAVKSYTADALAALKETKSEGYSYVFWKGEDMKAVVATELVTLDALLADAGTTFGAGDELKFTCSDGPYPKGDFHYEVMAERLYDADKNTVPSAIAITYGNTLEAQETSGKLRFVCGATAAEVEAKNAAGARMPSDVVAVTVLKAESVPVEPPVNPFKDVEEGAYYYDAVLWAADKRITEGTTATTFAPAKTCTRAEAVTFLWRAAGSPAVTDAKNPFEDVKEDSYYYNAVLWAVEKKITEGTTEKTFSPDDTCTRAQIVTFLWRSAGAAEVKDAANPFDDVKADAYYFDAVLWAVGNKITLGTSEKTFSPGDTCTRGEIVTFLHRNFVK